MKDLHDHQTTDMLPTKRPRGRPSTGSALSGAERQAKYRAKMNENSVTVRFNREDVAALKLLLANPNPALDVSPEALERIVAALFTAAIEQGR